MRQEFTRAWGPLSASAVGNGLGVTGITYYSFGVFVVPLMEAFGWTRGQATRGASFLLIGTAITAPIIGFIIDRIGARRAALVSVLGLVAGYFALSQQNGTLSFFYATLLLTSLAGGGTTPVVYTRAVSMWFDKGRGLALGLTLAGTGIAGIFGPSLCSALIGTYGWRGGYIGLAGLTLVSFPILLMFFHERELPASSTSNTRMGSAGLSVAEAVKTVDFWKIALGFFVVAATVGALMINLVPLMRDRGVSAQDAARLAGAMGIAVLVGRIGLGYLLDRFHAPAVALLVISQAAFGALLLTWDSAPSWVPMVSAVSFGLVAAGEVDLIAFLTSRYFGMKAYGKIYGWQVTSFFVGTAAGPIAAGVAFDVMQGYTEVLYVGSALFITGGMVVGSLGRAPTYRVIREISGLTETVQ